MPRRQVSSTAWSTGSSCPSDASSRSPTRAPTPPTRLRRPDPSAARRPFRRSSVVTSTQPALDALLHENRRFEPPEDLARDANAKPELYDEAAIDRIGFWEPQAEWLSWSDKWQQA